jgi:hypothetical protein
MGVLGEFDIVLPVGRGIIDGIGYLNMLVGFPGESENFIP